MLRGEGEVEGWGRERGGVLWLEGRGGMLLRNVVGEGGMLLRKGEGPERTSGEESG